MARMNDTVTLTENNRIYLYDLLSRELGCGKQTFITKVEEALDTDRMGAADLGFADTRALLEALGDFISLKVFKGGRLYATVIAQPAWDEALAAAGSGKAAPQPGKPWKKKKGAKALKPVRPKRVKREEPKPAADAANAEASSAPDAASASAGSGAPSTPVDAATGASDGTVSAPSAALANANGGAPSTPADAPASEAVTGNDAVDADCAAALHSAAPGGSISSADATQTNQTDARADPNAASAPECDAAEPAPAENAEVPRDLTPEPAFSLTVTYDPYCGFEGEAKLESSPVAASGPEEEPAVAAARDLPAVPRVAIDAAATAAAAARRANRTSARHATFARRDVAPALGLNIDNPSLAAESADAPIDVKPASSGDVATQSKATTVDADREKAPSPTAQTPLPDFVNETHTAPITASKLHATASAAPHSTADVPAPKATAVQPEHAASAVDCSNVHTAHAQALETPGGGAGRSVPEPQPEPKPAPTPETDTALGPIPTTTALKGYPSSFRDEVYCPAEIIGELIEALPFGTDALCLLAADYDRARDLQLIRGTRAEATFPLRIQRAASVRPIAITIHKRSGAGMSWAITGVDA